MHDDKNPLLRKAKGISYHKAMCQMFWGAAWLERRLQLGGLWSTGDVGHGGGDGGAVLIWLHGAAESCVWWQEGTNHPLRNVVLAVITRITILALYLLVKSRQFIWRLGTHKDIYEYSIFRWVAAAWPQDRALENSSSNGYWQGWGTRLDQNDKHECTKNIVLEYYSGTRLGQNDKHECTKNIVLESYSSDFPVPVLVCFFHNNAFENDVCTMHEI